MFDDIIIHLHGRHIWSLSFVDHLDVNFISQLAFKAKVGSFTIAESIFVEGEYGSKIYIVISGKVAMIHKKSHTYLDDLETEEHFGEIEFFTN